MPFELVLARYLRTQGWKVKIRENERLEPPHVTILHRTRSWRFGLREEDFLAAVVDEIMANMDTLVEEWNSKYPENPVSSEDD